MKKRLIEVDGTAGELAFRFDNSAMEAKVTWPGHEPHPHLMEYREVEPGVYSLLAGHASLEARLLERPGGKWLVEVGGRSFEVTVRDPREAAALRNGRGADGQQQVQSPMPGKVVRVLVEEGAQVEAGQGLVVVEAMKMQNEMKAPKAGKVVAVLAKAGASVTAGEVLVTLE